MLLIISPTQRSHQNQQAYGRSHSQSSFPFLSLLTYPPLVAFLSVVGEVWHA